MKISKKKTQIIKELKRISKRLGHSAGRREIPLRLYKECVKHFGSLNKAKKKANLKVHRRLCPKLPKKAYRITKDLAKIASYVTFDGHLHKDLKAFYLSSKDVRSLKDFKEIVERQMGTKCYYKWNSGGLRGQTHKVYCFNTSASKLLHNLGVPKGDKMLVPFEVPNWIKEKKILAKEYLKIFYYCEGCKFKTSRNTERIHINLNKCEELIEEGLNFMNSLKALLKQFEIETTNVRISKGTEKRKRDGKTTKTMRFSIRGNSFNRFINVIGWLK